MIFLKDEICASVLEGESTPLWNDACAESAVVAVDEGHTIAVSISDSEIDCVTMVVGWRAMVDDARRLLWVK